MRYNSKRTGKFRSQLEQTISEKLPRKRGVKISYETHTISYSIPRTYHPDFTITLANGHVIHVEVKGYFRPEDRTKMKYVKLCNPTLDIRMIFPRINKKDIAWCTKMGIPYAIGEVPRGWLNGSR
jgi:predicted nuclease of restriction endonuclease-like RecB superfamily